MGRGSFDLLSELSTGSLTITAAQQAGVVYGGHGYLVTYDIEK